MQIRDACTLRMANNTGWTQHLVPRTWLLAALLFTALLAAVFGLDLLMQEKESHQADSQHTPPIEEILVVNVDGSPLWDLNPVPPPPPIALPSLTVIRSIPGSHL